MERQVFLCTWQWSLGRYRVWVRDRPTLAAEGDFFAAADERLADTICEATGDGENVREYDPAAPREEQPGLLMRLAAISGERRGLIDNASELFTEGICPQCGNARGKRSSAGLRLSRLKSGGNAGYATIQADGFGGPMIGFFAEAFVARLSAQERDQFDWRPVESVRGKQVFLEPTAARVQVPFVSLSDFAASLWSTPSLRSEQTMWWQCDTCGRTQQPVYWYRVGKLPHYYVSSASLPDPMPTSVGVGELESPRLCFTRDRWSELVALPEARGLMSTDIGMVPSSLVDPMPPTRPLSEFTKGAAKRG